MYLSNETSLNVRENRNKLLCERMFFDLTVQFNDVQNQLVFVELLELINRYTLSDPITRHWQIVGNELFQLDFMPSLHI